MDFYCSISSIVIVNLYEYLLIYAVGGGDAIRKFGADIKTASVAIIVNKVNIIRHNLSTTIAANFQSFAISDSSSSFFSCKHSP